MFTCSTSVDFSFWNSTIPIRLSRMGLYSAGRFISNRVSCSHTAEPWITRDVVFLASDVTKSGVWLSTHVDNVQDTGRESDGHRSHTADSSSVSPQTRAGPWAGPPPQQQRPPPTRCPSTRTCSTLMTWRAWTKIWTSWTSANDGRLGSGVLRRGPAVGGGVRRRRGRDGEQRRTDAGRARARPSAQLLRQRGYWCWRTDAVRGLMWWWCSAVGASCAGESGRNNPYSLCFSRPTFLQLLLWAFLVRRIWHCRLRSFPSEIKDMDLCALLCVRCVGVCWSYR